MNVAIVSDPITVNKTVLKNRLTMAPTVKFDYAGEDASVTEKHIEHYGKRAKGGCDGTEDIFSGVGWCICRNRLGRNEHDS